MDSSECVFRIQRVASAPARLETRPYRLRSNTRSYSSSALSTLNLIVLILFSLAALLAAANVSKHVNSPAPVLQNASDPWFDVACNPTFLHRDPFLVLGIPLPPYPAYVYPRRIVQTYFRKSLLCWGPGKSVRHARLDEDDLLKIQQIYRDARDKMLLGFPDLYPRLMADEDGRIRPLRQSIRWQRETFNQTWSLGLGPDNVGVWKRQGCLPCDADAVISHVIHAAVTPWWRQIHDVDIRTSCPPCMWAQVRAGYTFLLGEFRWNWRHPLPQLQHGKLVDAVDTMRLPPVRAHAFWQTMVMNPRDEQRQRNMERRWLTLLRLGTKFARTAACKVRGNTHCSTSCVDQAPCVVDLFTPQLSAFGRNVSRPGVFVTREEFARARAELSPEKVTAYVKGGWLGDE